MKNEINALIMQAMKEYDVELSQECIDNLSRNIENLLTITCIQNKQNKQVMNIQYVTEASENGKITVNLPNREESIEQLKNIINEYK